MGWKLPLAVIALLVLWDAAVPLFGIRQMPPWTLKARLAAGDAPVLLDVRTPFEYRLFHIPGAVNAPFPPPPPERLGIARDAEIVLICMTGHRSPVAAHQLKQAGYADVGNLMWGMAGYKLLGGPTVSGDAPADVPDDAPDGES